MPFMMKLGLDENGFISLLDFFFQKLYRFQKYQVLPILTNHLSIQFPMMKKYFALFRSSIRELEGERRS